MKVQQEEAEKSQCDMSSVIEACRSSDNIIKPN